jgi:hypothetical protein
LSGSIVVIGLPSEGLETLAGGLEIPLLDNEEIRAAHDAAGRGGGVSREWMAERLAGQVRVAGEAGALLVYQTPWRFRRARPLARLP